MRDCRPDELTSAEGDVAFPKGVAAAAVDPGCGGRPLDVVMAAAAAWPDDDGSVSCFAVPWASA